MAHRERKSPRKADAESSQSSLPSLRHQPGDLVIDSTVSMARKQARRQVEQQQQQQLQSGAAAAYDFTTARNYIEQDVLVELQKRPKVSFTITNANGVAHEQPHETETRHASSVTATPPPDASTTTTTWRPRVHVPLAHRKLVNVPQIFTDVAPFPPTNEPKATPSIAKPSPKKMTNMRLETIHKPESNQTSTASASLSSRHQVERNQPDR